MNELSIEEIMKQYYLERLEEYKKEMQEDKEYILKGWGKHSE